MASERTDIPRSDSPLDHRDRVKTPGREKSAKFASGTQSPSAEHPERQTTPWPDPVDSLEADNSPRGETPEFNTTRSSAQDIERDSLEINNQNEQLGDYPHKQHSPVDWEDSKDGIDRDKTPTPQSYEVDREKTPVYSENKDSINRENSDKAHTPVNYDRNATPVRDPTPQRDSRADRYPTPHQSRSPQSRQSRNNSRNQSRKGDSPPTRGEGSASSSKVAHRRDSYPKEITPVPRSRGSRRASETRDPPEKLVSAHRDPWASPPPHSPHNSEHNTPNIKSYSGKSRDSNIQRVYVESPTFSKEEEEQFRFVKSRLDDPESLENTIDKANKMDSKEKPQAAYSKQDDADRYENRDRRRSREKNDSFNRRDSQRSEEHRRNDRHYDRQRERSRERVESRGNDNRYRQRSGDSYLDRDDRRDDRDFRYNERQRYEDRDRYHNRRNDREIDYRDNDRQRSVERHPYRDRRNDVDMQRYEDRSPPRNDRRDAGDYRNREYERSPDRHRSQERDYGEHRYPHRRDDRSQPPKEYNRRQNDERYEEAQDNDRYSRHDDRYEPKPIRHVVVDSKYDSNEEADLRRESAYQDQLKNRIKENQRESERAIVRIPRPEDSHDFARDSLEDPYDKRYVDESVPNGYSDINNSKWESPPQNPFVNKQNAYYDNRDSNDRIGDHYDKENYDPYRNDTYKGQRINSFESYNGQYDAAYDHNFQERFRQPHRGNTPRYYGMPEKTPENFDPEDAAKMELAHPTEPRVNYVEKNKYDYGYINRKTYKEIKDNRLEEKEKLNSVFVDVKRKKNKSNVRQPAHTRSGPPASVRHHSEFSQHQPYGQYKPSSAEELWMKRASNLSTMKDNKLRGKKQPSAGQFTKPPSNSGRTMKNPSPKAYHLEPMHQRSTVPVEPKYYDDYYSTSNNAQSISPTRRPVELKPISQEILTDDGQRISLDINLKLLSPQPGQQDIESRSVQPKSYAGNEVAVYNPNYYDQPEQLTPRKTNDSSPSHNSLSSYNKIPPISTVEEYDDQIEPYEEQEGGYAAQFRKARTEDKEPVNYKVYTIRDYKNMIKEVQAGRGKLGPDLDTETYKDKVEKRQKQIEYARLANEKNKSELATRRPFQPKYNETEQKKKRRSAIEYSKNIPKPQVKPRPNQYNSYDVAAQLSPGRKNRNTSPRRGNSKTSVDVDLDQLRQRHEQDKQAVAAIRQNMEPVSQRA